MSYLGNKVNFNPSIVRFAVTVLGLYLGFGLPLLSTGHYWHHFEEAEHHHETERVIHAHDGKGPVIHREHSHVGDHCSLCVYASIKKETLSQDSYHKSHEFSLKNQRQLVSGINPKKILYRTRLPARASPAPIV